MRGNRGANITDIVILIIDACEGVLEQTKGIIIPI